LLEYCKPYLIFVRYQGFICGVVLLK